MAQSCTSFNPTIFQPLQSPRSIRLLIVYPGKFGDTIQCALFPYELSKAIPYEALSYCWGASEPSVSIVCNGQPFDVGPNLGAALQRLRHSNVGANPRTWLARAIWIDAICINQMDLGERSQQVSFMADIYTQARRVIIWLGEDDNFAASAFSIIHKVSPVALDDFIPGMKFIRKETVASVLKALSTTESTGAWLDQAKRNMQPSRYQRLLSGEGLYYDDFLPSHDHYAWAALLEVLESPYFTRAWIIQEVFCAREAIILIGGYSLSWEVFAKCIAWLIENGYFRILRFHRSIFLANQVLSLCSQVLKGQSGNLHSLFTLYSTSEARDPRDKIYALLGLISEKERNVPELRVDYSKPVADIYISATRYLLTMKSNGQKLSLQGTVDILVARRLGIRIDRRLEDLTLRKSRQRGATMAFHPGYRDGTSQEKPSLAFINHPLLRRGTLVAEFLSRFLMLPMLDISQFGVSGV